MQCFSLEYFLQFNNTSTSIIAPVLHFLISVAVQVDSGCIPNTQAALAAWTPHCSHFLWIRTWKELCPFGQSIQIHRGTSYANSLSAHSLLCQEKKKKSLSFSILTIINHDAHLEECQVYNPYETVQNTQPVNYLYFHMEAYFHMLSVILKCT